MVLVNTAQQKASNPKVSAWVQASAGSGKTKVLIDRIVNLLLNDVPCDRILCLSYTKAAASEMNERLMGKLKEFYTSNDADIRESISSFTNVSESIVTKAKNLFIETQKNPQGVRFMTLHGFCQSILEKFPIEAGISPGFSIITEEEKNEVIDSCIFKLFESEPNYKYEISRFFSETHYRKLVFDAFSIKGRLSQTDISLKSYEEDCGYILNEFIEESHPCGIIQIKESQIKEDIVNFKATTKIDSNLIDIFKKIKNEENTEIEKEYISIFLTSKLDIRKKFASANFIKRFPEIYDWMTNESLRIKDLIDSFNCKKYLYKNAIFFQGMKKLYEYYDSWKDKRGILDFDDLILKTINLLENTEDGSYVLFKTDQRFDHFLMDESQDTSPMQWRVVTSLLQEFCNDKTVFAVGDSKQSIYSFQDAHPKSFVEIQKSYFEEKSYHNNHTFLDIELNTCYRCSKEILSFVDKVFSKNSESLYLKKPLLHHGISRDNDNEKNNIVIHPLFEDDELNLKHIWDNNEENQSLDRVEKLSNYIANLVSKWICEKKEIKSKKRSIKPCDIMILLKRRSSTMHLISRAIRKKGIQISSSSNNKLNEHLLIMDIISVAKFAIQPNDDLNLACLLKSPLFNLSEEEIFFICSERTTTIWQRLWSLHEGDEKIGKIYKKLRYYLKIVDIFTTQQFFSQILFKENGYDLFKSEHGIEADSLIQSFQDIVLTFSQSQSNSMCNFLLFFEKSSSKQTVSGNKKSGIQILTIHGAKGLQSPVVILADSNDPVKSRSDTILINQSDSFTNSLPYLNTSINVEKIVEIKTKIEKESIDEHLRLLYVALTRAEDCIHILGCKNRSDDDNSWYNLLSSV